MAARAPRRRGDRLLHDLGQLAGRGDRPLAARLDDRPRDPAGEAFLAVAVEDVRDLPLVPSVDDVRRREIGGPVHPHVERRVVPVAEPALRLIELRTGDAEIEQDAVHAGHAVLQRDAGFSEPGAQMPEIAPDQRDAIHVGREPLAGVRDRRLVLIEGDQPPAGAELPGDPLAVAASAERAVDVYAVRLYVQAVDGFLQQHRHMMKQRYFLPGHGCPKPAGYRLKSKSTSFSAISLNVSSDCR